MIEVSQAFKDAWADVQRRVVDYKISYKRRYWNGSAFVLESVATILPKREIVSISPIKWKLDTQGQNKILASNLTLRLLNDRFKWNESNTTDGLFKADDIAVLGYDPFRTEVQVLYGLQISDDNFEFIPLFTGEIVDIMTDSKSGTAEVTIRGRESKMQLADAQRVSTQFTNEAAVPATGDGANKVFLAKTSVWEISTVRVDAVAIDQGSRYKISNTNSAEDAAKITIDPAPASGQTVDWTGRQWLADKKVSDLVGLLADESGIGVSERDIEEPQYQGAASFLQISSKADWDAGTKVGVEAESRDGFLTYGDPVKGRSFVTQEDLDANWDKTGDVSIIASSFDSDNMCLINITGLGVTTFARLIPVYGGTSIEIPAIGGGGQWPTNQRVITAGTEGPYRFRIGFKNNGIDAGFIETKAGNSLIQNNTRLSFFASTFSNGLIVDAIRAIPPYDGIYTSKVLNLGSTPTVWGKLVAVEELNGGTTSYKTATSDDGINFDPFVAIASDGTILSALKRFIKVEVTLGANLIRTNGPEIDNITINFFSENLTIGHANFKAKTAFQAVQRIAEITDMEFGFNGAGRFFFRNKPPQPISLLSIDQQNAIIKISTIKPGYDRVINIAQVSYNNYYKEVDSASEGESSPTSVERFGRKIKTLDIKDFLFSNNADYAVAIAQVIYKNNHLPKRTMTLDARIIPHLELSDVITVSWFDSPQIQNPVFGDALNKEPTFGPSKNVPVRDMLAKVVGLSTDIMAGKMTIEIQEVLQ